MISYEIIRLKEFINWYDNERSKSQIQIESRLKKITYEGYFGNYRNLGSKLFELKFNDGRRVYYSLLQSGKSYLIVLLLGGNKNGQEKDIWKARAILKKNGPY